MTSPTSTPEDLMILMGGYASYPSNDVWITTDGNKWM